METRKDNTFQTLELALMREAATYIRRNNGDTCQFPGWTVPHHLHSLKRCESAGTKFIFISDSAAPEYRNVFQQFQISLPRSGTLDSSHPAIPSNRRDKCAQLNRWTILKKCQPPTPKENGFLSIIALAFPALLGKRCGARRSEYKIPLTWTPKPPSLTLWFIQRHDLP